MRQLPQFTFFSKTDFPHKGITARKLHSLLHPHLLILGVRKPRRIFGPEIALDWESMNLWDKRGNALDNSRSGTVHKHSTFHHTHWWNLLPVNTHCSKHRFLLEMREKNHLFLKSTPNMIHMKSGYFCFSELETRQGNHWLPKECSFPCTLSSIFSLETPRWAVISNHIVK